MHFLNINSLLDGVLVVSSYNNLSFIHLLHHIFEVSEVVVSGRLEIMYYRVLVVVLLS